LYEDQFDLSTFSDGIYLLIVTSNKLHSTKKIIKMNK
jgi:hypothetical protein